MKDYLQGSSNADNAKEDIEGMKKDIQSLVHRLSSIKDNARDEMSEQLDNLSTTISGLKDKGLDLGKDGLEGLSSSTRKHPLRNLAYAFGAGFIIAYLTK